MTYEISTLPGFLLRVISQPSNETQRQQDKQTLWQRFHSGCLNEHIRAFSPSMYVVSHHMQANTFTLSVGKLITTASMEDKVEDTQLLYLPAQHYAVFTLPENPIQAVQNIWQTLPNLNLDRSHQFDFEYYPRSGAAKLYIGLKGEVVLESE